MPPKKLKKFCGITKFIQQNDKDLHQALDDLCLFGLFRPRGRGVTFLYPSDKAYRKKIIDHAYSNNPEKAVDMVRALVLLDYLPSPADFKNKKDDISNALHKKLEVESADANEVKLKSGHKLVIEATYKHLRDGDPVALYTMSGKGELPTTGTAATMKYNNTNPSTHKGGSGESIAIRITNCVEKFHMDGNLEIYQTVVGIIYIYARSVQKAELIYHKICASARASFYNIVAPWKKERDIAIDELLEKSGIQLMVKCTTKTINDLIATYANLYNENLMELIKATGHDTITKKRDEIRKKLLKDIQQPIDARIAVFNAYMSFYSDEKIAKSSLYRDLLTVYCYLSARNELEDTTGTYYEHSFRFVMKHVFNHNDSFSESCSETVYNLLIFHNLLKSDAFLYKPVYENTQIDEFYRDLRGQLPIPNDKNLFTIQFNPVITAVGGGGDGDDSFFGGIVNKLPA